LYFPFQGSTVIVIGKVFLIAPITHALHDHAYATPPKTVPIFLAAIVGVGLIKE
jgi:hypothetical protein